MLTLYDTSLRQERSFLALQKKEILRKYCKTIVANTTKGFQRSMLVWGSYHLL